MSSKTALRVLRLSAPSRFPSVHPQQARSQQRTFLSLPGTEPQTLTATRILPYKSTSLYTIIANVDSYHTFLPYCLDSRVTQWSSPDQTGKKWPSTADLKVGWGGYEEIFSSKLHCVPDSVVEALAGEATTSLPSSDLKHHASSHPTAGLANDIFKSLSTRWTIKPFHYKPPSGRPQTDNATHPARDQTEVNLVIEFQFSNPIYAALSQAVAPKVAGIMIEAFEVRARKLLDGPGAAVTEDGPLEGVLHRRKVGV